MKFYGEPGEYLELRAVNTEGNIIQLQTTLSRNDETVWSESFTAAKDELIRLAQWLENLWDECAPALLGGILTFRFSHREHIGEGYYHIVASGKNLLLVYEQLGQSNLARAAELRALAQG